MIVVQITREDMIQQNGVLDINVKTRVKDVAELLLV